MKFKTDYYSMMNKEFTLGIDSFVRMCVYHHLRYMWYWRSYERKKSLLKRLIILKYSHKYGLEISPEAKIGEHLYLGHPYNITVGADVIMGHHVSLHKGVTIGRENRGARKGSPTIGNYVWVGINSTIVGQIRIGNDVLIAPNCFVNSDIPDHSVVVGNPAVVHHKERAVEDYIRLFG